MRHFHKVIVATDILLLLTTPLTARASAATFDGEWSVHIASPKSECGNGATVSIGISNGQVGSSDTMMRASGRVADAGNISVMLTSGIKRAVGSGHLSGTSGSGTWHGTLCSGTWTAERI
ncbi:MAG: hypothetical protein JOY90_08050 [Bradyrhizobium sp.]|uniref:hypothetical protein n=1 Tax=Bradyrhizobium sp. TaxID=376 RepID=UPI001D4C3B6D|nr:hypothetical protein [Bradyrhizobium sp.]MBV9560396.1 hypothetical protein [Bradyrhizobium sp.]